MASPAVTSPPETYGSGTTCAALDREIELGNSPKRRRYQSGDLSDDFQSSDEEITELDQGHSVDAQQRSQTNEEPVMVSSIHTKKSCFSDNVRAGFLRLLANKKRRMLKSPEEIMLYTSILQETPDAPIGPPPGSDRRARQNFSAIRIRVKKEYAIIDGKLQRATPKTGLFRLVASTVDALDIVEEIHINQGHFGTRLSSDKVSEEFWGISEPDILWLIKRCSICHVTRQTSPKPPPNPIVSMLPFERVQMDLMDFTNEESNGYKWILHLKDHFSKLTILFALPDKTSEGIAKHLSTYIGFYGRPEIVQCDNGKEFKGAVRELLEERGVKVINGRPRAPQVQGLVERGNGTVKSLLAAWKRQNDRDDWENLLEFIERAINTSSCKGLPRRVTPYHAIYGHGRPPELEKWRVELPMSVSDLTDHIAMGLDLNDVIPQPDFYDPTPLQEIPMPTKEDIDCNMRIITELHKTIREHQAILRQRTIRVYARNTPIYVFQKGEYCSVKIPIGVRAGSDSKRFPAEVLTDPNYDTFTYKVLSPYGELDSSVLASDINHLPKEMWGEIKEYLKDADRLKQVSMSHIGTENLRCGFKLIFCKCKSDCSSTRCICKREKEKCTQYCKFHNTSNCSNRGTIQEGTPAAIVSTREAIANSNV